MRRIFLLAILAIATANVYAGDTIIAVVSRHADALPRRNLTPGFTNLDIRQDTIAETICNPKWSTKSIRPSSSYTNKLKRQGMNQYGLRGQPGDYEEDHLISLELGGHPTDPRNLWPEKWDLVINGEEVGAHTKDKLENRLHKMVCAGDITLADAQDAIATDWITAYRRFVGPLPKGK